MDALSLGFLILVVLMGGVIALAADRLGRKLGKKRLSLLGMRPRHTAEVITVSAGIVIPFLTVAIIMAASSDVREWLVEGRRLAARSVELQGQVEDLTQRGEQLDKDIRDKTAQTESLDRELKAVQGRLVLFEGQVRRYMRESQEASRRAQTLQKRLGGLNEQLKSRLTALKTAQVSLQNAQKAYAVLMRDYQTVEREREESYEENLRLGRENEELNDQIVEIRQMVSQLETDRDRLKGDLDKVRAAYEDTISNFEADLERIKLQRDQRQGELKAAEELLALRTEQLRQNLGKTRTEPMVFEFGEELARLPIEPGRTADQAESILVSLLRTARTRATEKGAQPSATTNVSAGLVDILYEGRTLTAAQQEAEIEKNITGHKENLVLVATASFNTFRSEFVPLMVRVYRNPIIFKEGEAIAETRIDGNQSEDQVAKAVADFVRTQVVARAVQEQMIPAKGREDVFGQVEILEVVQQIFDAKRTVRLRAVADEATRASGPLKIRFVIR